MAFIALWQEQLTGCVLVIGNAADGYELRLVQGAALIRRAALATVDEALALGQSWHTEYCLPSA